MQSTFLAMLALGMPRISKQGAEGEAEIWE